MSEYTQKENVITVDGRDFNTTDLSEHAKEQLVNLDFVDEQIMQRNNEIQIIDSARLMYSSVLKSELVKVITESKNKTKK